MPFLNVPRLIYYLHARLLIFKNNNPKNDFNLVVNLTQSNGPLSTNKIIGHFVSHSASKNDKVQIDCLIMLVGSINLFQLTRWFLLHLSFWVFFIRKLNK